MPSLPARRRTLVASALLRAAVLAMPLGLAAFPAAVSADIKPAEPSFVVITKDNIPMKAADGNLFRPVRILKTGDILRADGSGDGWLRVEYLPDTKAYVVSDDVTFDAGTKKATLSRPSKLMANDITGAAPWWPLLKTDLPVGTAFDNAEPVKNPDGSVRGYLIAAPTSSRGFVRVEATRPATSDEVKGFRGADGSTVAVAPTTPAPTEPTTAAPTPVAPDSTATAPTTPPATPDPITMTNQSSPASNTPASTTPVPATPTTPSTDAAPTVTDAPPSLPRNTNTSTSRPAEPRPVVPAVTSRVDDLNTLRSMFDRTMTTGNEAELQTVITEFNRTIASLGSSPTDNQIRKALEQRLEAIKMRQQLFDIRRELANSDTQVVEQTRQVTVAIEEAQKQAIYTIVGRMLPSTVYDGRRGIPLMYRIESADISSTRTIGYVVPREDVELLTKMGKTVGIVGEAKFDPALGVNIVAPKRVDVLEIVGGRLQVKTDTQTTTTTNTVNGQATSTSTTTTTTTTSGSIGADGQDVPDAPNK